MGEERTIDRAAMPLTVATLTTQFGDLGVRAGQTILLHSALSRLGWVAGGAVAVVQGLMAVLGETGTLMVPTHSSENTDPAQWMNPPVPVQWWPVIREHTPAFDPQITPSRGVGIVPEVVRTWPGAQRSTHPTGSFAAVGSNAAALTSIETALDDDFGESSPLRVLYDLDGYVLLLGVGHSNNTSLHLAEYRADYQGKQRVKQGSAVMVNDERVWKTYDALDLDTDDFDALGAAFEAAHPEHVQLGKIGKAESRLVKQRPLVDFAVNWLAANR